MQSVKNNSDRASETTIGRTISSTSVETGSESMEERFELNLTTALEFAVTGAVVWLVGFAVVSFLMGWF
jgi:hypothetical protein